LRAQISGSVVAFELDYPYREESFWVSKGSDSSARIDFYVETLALVELENATTSAAGSSDEELAV
jgi:hypothetical protein